MKNIMFFLLISLNVITASAQVRTAIVAVERQFQNPRVITHANTVRVNCSPYPHTIPYAGVAYNSYTTHNYNRPVVEYEPAGTPVWVYVFMGVCAICFTYLIFNGLHEKKQNTTTYECVQYPVCHHANIPNQFVELANGGGILVKG